MPSDQVPPSFSANLQASGPTNGAQPGITMQPDGRVVYTHGHRYPDNIQRVTQTHRPDGTLESAHITLSGFAGSVLDITATFDAAGKLLREDGYRAAGVKEPVSSFLLPLPTQAVQSTQATQATQPVQQPVAASASAGVALKELSELSGFGGVGVPPATAAQPTPTESVAAPSDARLPVATPSIPPAAAPEKMGTDRNSSDVQPIPENSAQTASTQTDVAQTDLSKPDSSQIKPRQ